ncbi:carbohydrate ABC transporter permease [Paenibacillus thalictri]|uniref:Sugar ABC transporter permease n=1 Tax=Paenibacillus thalictri TaxID=2527873 RepID=A0A4Q9DLF8_9BACL|nr:sugar ABC transporter permease [Paenibacillus thalictri]TBL73268.1 sugar ABC transporter permease [Paenibacillus thalictri]
MKVSKTIYLFLVPGTVLYLLFFVYPTLSGFYYSFTNFDGMSDQFKFVGMNNYKNLLTEDMIFAKSLGNNLKFMLFVVLAQSIVSLLFALFLVKNTRSNILFRAVYFFPTIISSTAVGFIWTFMYDPSMGLINQALNGMNLPSLAMNWTGDIDIAIYSVAFVQVWAHIGQMMVIFIAGLQGIPEDLYEVAKIEGANNRQTFVHVTWPLIKPAATIVVAYTTIQSFKAFDLIYVMTGGGPVNSTEILSTFLYHTAFQSYRFGYASAGSFLFLAIIGLITLIQFRLLKSNAA